MSKFKGDPEFVILKKTAWLAAAEYENKILGCITRQPLRPTVDFLPYSPLQYNDYPLEEGTLENFSISNSNKRSREVSTSLQSLTSFAFKGSTEDAVHLTSRRVRYRRLTQHSQFWERLRTDADVTRIVPGWISLLNTWPPCLVVGIMIAADADLEVTGAASRGLSASLGLPLAAAALGGIPIGVGDPQVGFGVGARAGRVFQASVPDERIFALELRIVTTPMLRKRELVLKEGGPKFRPGRLAGNDDGGSSSEDEDVLPDIGDLVLEQFTESEYAKMS